MNKSNLLVVFTLDDQKYALYLTQYMFNAERGNTEDFLRKILKEHFLLESFL
ncbi:MAG: hypothetical protein HOD37_05350 [Bacteroidetes bacterium]|jgi:hypothetical protein|nr:hypothetical protein [Bacteroidota bacterium]